MTLDAYLATLPDRCEHLYARNQGCPTCVPVAPDQGKAGAAGTTDEWSLFRGTVLAAARPDGTVHQGDVRPLIRGRIAPKHIGSLYRRARSEGLLVDTGQLEPSTDTAGRNGDKTSRVYAIGRAS